MADLTQVAHDDEDISPSTTVTANVQGFQGEPAPPPPAPVMRIKNLDTGEEYDLEDFDTRTSFTNGNQGAAGTPDHVEGLNEDEDPGSREGGGRRKAWLKGTKKLKTWAKATLTNVKEKIEERIEKQQLQRHLQKVQLQEQLQQQLQLQQQQPDASRDSSSFGGWGRGDEAAPAQHGEGRSRHSQGLMGPLDADSVEAGRDAGSAGTLGSVQPGGDSPAYGRGGSLDFSVRSNPGGLPTPQYLTKPAAPLGAGTRTGGGAAPDSGSAGGDAAAAATQSVSSLGDSGCGPPGPPAAAAAGPGAVTGSGLETTRGPAGAKAGSGGATPRQQVPPLPPFWSLVSQQQQPLGAGAAGSAAGVMGGGLYSEELRTPLLEEDRAGPSSRAVPSTKSWLNLPARVTGGRRAAGRQLQQVRMIQEVLGHDGPVWAMKFSADARLLATAGRDGVLRLWSVYWNGGRRSRCVEPARNESAPGPPALGGPAPQHTGGGGAAAAAGPGTAGGAGAAPRPPLLSESPLLLLSGHRGDVLDLAWSQCRLLLTASADQTARLWCIDVPLAAGSGGAGDAAARGGGGAGGGGDGDGIRRASGSGSGPEGSGGEPGGATPPSGECLRSFVHPDFVTSCCFHPADPRCIVTGCADGKVRVWSVPDAAVVATATVQQDIITRLLFSADGSRLVVGTLRGKVRHYEFNGAALECITQIDVKNPHGSGRKVTGLTQVPYTYGNNQQYIITSADSRIRLYVGFTQERKFKGHRHTNTQIAASLSPSCQHLICGSDDGWVYVWETGLPPPPLLSSTAGAGAGGAAAGTSAGAAGDGGGGAGVGSATARGRAVGAAGREAAPAAALRGAGKVKEGSYEAFQTPEQTTTVAIMAPNVCRRGRGLEALGLAQPAASGGSSGGPGSSTQPQLSLMGALFVVAGFSGKIYVYENLPAQW